MNPLVEKIKAAPHTSHRLVSETGGETATRLQNLPPELVQQISWLFAEIDDIKLFSSDHEEITRDNGWFVDSSCLGTNMLETTVGEITDTPLDYLENYRMLGSWSQGHILAIGTSEEFLGKIAVVFCSIRSDGGNVPIIANSLEEWFERAIADGPDCEEPYWRREGFEDLGSAIPDDPLYESPVVA